MAVELLLSYISAVIALVREVCDRWDDPTAWREHPACAGRDPQLRFGTRSFRRYAAA